MDSQKSTSGYCFFIGKGAVSWSSKLQQTVALSTTEAEYQACVHTGKEAIWFRSFLTELGYQLNGPTLLRLDNRSAMAVANNPEHHSCMKHVDIKLHWIREKVRKHQIHLEFVSTHDMTADLFTKPLPKLKHAHHHSRLGLVDSVGA